MKNFGLIGYPLSSSFSQKYFTEKFTKEKINASYQLFPLENISKLPELIKNQHLEGLNVTIPYKQKVFDFLTELDENAAEIGAVNVIKINQEKGILKGYNTDAIGFENSLKPLLLPHHKQALILGTGGASKAVAYVLKKLGIPFHFVSRVRKNDILQYEDLTSEIIQENNLIINATPLGMYPPEACPNIPYDAIGEKHLLYDLIYNPAKTTFLKKGEAQKATIKNGLDMLYGQAIAAWEIWNS